jgi:hypothetical protein
VYLRFWPTLRITFRLRLFRLARYWTGLNIVLRILGAAFKASAYLLALVLLFMFVMGLLGMQVCVCA